MDLILGGAQLADNYGVSNKKKGINFYDLKKIFKYKNKKKIIDTAYNYKGSIEIISKYLNQYNLNVNLKIDLGNNQNYIKKFFIRINDSLSKLNCDKIHSIMIHDTKNFINLNKNQKSKILKGLQKLKRLNKIDKFGFSIYDQKELNEIRKIKKFDLLQFPANIFDQNILRHKYLDLLKKRGVEIHVRSIFLQGLVFLSYAKTKKIVGTSSVKLEKFFQLFEKKKDKIFHCINFIKNQKNIDKVVVGFSSYNEFKEIVKSFESPLQKINYSKFIINNDKITKPYNWHKIIIN